MVTEIKNIGIDLPPLYKMAMLVGNAFVAMKLPRFRLDEQSLHNAATKQTGLTDFGDPYYRQGFHQLLKSLKEDANLHALGIFVAHELIVNYLIQRLRLVESRKHEPEIDKKPLHPPLIITGIARSGTTFLHNMLALNPTHYALPLWLLMHPFPETNGKRKEPDPRYVQAQRTFKFRKPMLPGLDSIHYTRVDSYEECILALGLTFNSLIFGTLLPVYGYMKWYLREEDTFQKYQEYRWLLQIFQSLKPEQRLTMKAPAHIGNLDAILRAIPGALVIQTHRDPVACISSVCSLLKTFHRGVSNEIDVHRMTSLTLDLYEIWFYRNLAFRVAHPSAVYDVSYDKLVSDPMETVRSIYSHFDLPWADKYESELEKYIQMHPKDKHGKHHYAASDFGLDENEIRERFQFYSKNFK